MDGCESKESYLSDVVRSRRSSRSRLRSRSINNSNNNNNNESLDVSKHSETCPLRQQTFVYPGVNFRGKVLSVVEALTIVDAVSGDIYLLQNLVSRFGLPGNILEKLRAYRKDIVKRWGPEMETCCRLVNNDEECKTIDICDDLDSVDLYNDNLGARGHMEKCKNKESGFNKKCDRTDSLVGLSGNPQEIYLDDDNDFQGWKKSRVKEDSKNVTIDIEKTFCNIDQEYEDVTFVSNSKQIATADLTQSGTAKRKNTKRSHRKVGEDCDKIPPLKKRRKSKLSKRKQKVVARSVAESESDAEFIPIYPSSVSSVSTEIISSPSNKESDPCTSDLPETGCEINQSLEANKVDGNADTPLKESSNDQGAEDIDLLTELFAPLNLSSSKEFLDANEADDLLLMGDGETFIEEVKSFVTAELAKENFGIFGLI